MKLKKSLMCVTLSILLSVQVYAATAFKDVKENAWYGDAVNYCAENGYVSGYNDGSFKPNNTITRAELAAVMNKMLGLNSAAKNTFRDVSNGKWYTTPVLNCVKAGIITGYSETKFGPNDKVTREQAAVILAKAFNIDKTNGRTSFSDDGKISNWAIGSVKAMQTAGLISGTGNNCFSPKAYVTRSAICQMICSAKKQDTVKYNIDSMLIPMYVRLSEEIPSMSDFWEWIRTYALYYSWDKRASDYKFTSYGLELTKQQVIDAAYAVIPEFDGSVPAMKNSDMMRHENGKYYFRMANPEDAYFIIHSVSEMSDGKIAVGCSYRFRGFDDAYYYEYVMEPNDHMNTSSATPYYYTILTTKIKKNEVSDDEDTAAKMLSEQEAYQIACDYWKYTPGAKDAETGFEYAVFKDGLNSENGRQYYQFRMRWLVETHWSTLDTVYVDAMTGECWNPNQN